MFESTLHVPKNKSWPKFSCALGHSQSQSGWAFAMRLLRRWVQLFQEATRKEWEWPRLPFYVSFISQKSKPAVDLPNFLSGWVVTPLEKNLPKLLVIQQRRLLDREGFSNKILLMLLYFSHINRIFRPFIKHLTLTWQNLAYKRTVIGFTMNCYKELSNFLYIE